MKIRFLGEISDGKFASGVIRKPTFNSNIRLINNEEVVCDNVLEITEEMLTTSSTILNNCYPKSWEQDHDYTSRFYYPKDYSKCLIYNGETLIFSGVVKNTGNMSLNPREPHYASLQVLDFYSSKKVVYL